jgi:chemotaxis protein CheD
LSPGSRCGARDLGSCIGIAVWDPVARVGGMAHVVLPESTTSSLGSPPGKYADLAVPALVRSVERLGGLPSRLVCNGTGVVRVRTVGAGTVEI